MTLYDFIYLVGCGVAYLMSVIGLIATEQIKGVKPQVFSLCIISFIPALLSWALPIWWLGYHFLIVRKERDD